MLQCIMRYRCVVLRAGSSALAQRRQRLRDASSGEGKLLGPRAVRPARGDHAGPYGIPLVSLPPRSSPWGLLASASGGLAWTAP